MEENLNIEEEQTISLSEIYEIIKKRFVLLVITTLIGGLIVGGYAFFIATPKYKSNGAIMVQVRSGGDESPVNTVESQRLVSSTIDILSQIDLIPKAASQLLATNGINYLPKEIKKGMSVTNKTNSLVIFLSFVSDDALEAEKVVEALITSLKDITNNEEYEGTLKGNITRLDVSEGKYDSPNKLLFTFVGLLLGGVVGLVYVFIVEMLNSGYKTKEEFEKAIGIQILAEIPEYRIEKRQ